MAAFTLTTKSLSLLACTALALVTGGLPAQRDEVTLPRRKPGNVTIEYGVVNLGAHGLHELAVGETWRMGHGDPSTLLTQVPLLAGNSLLAPGGYGVTIYRAGEADLRLNVGGGGGRGFGGGRGGRGRGGRGQGPGVQFPGELSEPKRKNKKLRLAWLPTPPEKTEKANDTEGEDAGASKSVPPKGLETCCLRVDFGPHRLDIPVTLVGASRHRVRGFLALGFTYPLKLFKDRTEPTPVLSLIPRKVKRGQPPGFNVMVGQDRVLLVPMSKAPEGRRGFGRGGRGGRGERPEDEDAGPEEIEGSVQWTPSQEPCDHVTIKAVKVANRNLQFEIHTGDRIGKVTVGMPASRKS